MKEPQMPERDEHLVEMHVDVILGMVAQMDERIALTTLLSAVVLYTVHQGMPRAKVLASLAEALAVGEAMFDEDKDGKLALAERMLRCAASIQMEIVTELPRTRQPKPEESSGGGG